MSFNNLASVKFNKLNRLYSWSTCPTMDLFVTTSKWDNCINFWRINGTLVWNINMPFNIRSKNIGVWRPDGKLLAFSQMDSQSVYFISVDTGKIVHSINLSEPILSINWVQSEAQTTHSFENQALDALPKLNPLPALVKDQNAMATFRMPHLLNAGKNNNSTDYVNNLINNGFPYLPCDPSTSSIMIPSNFPISSSTQSLLICRSPTSLQTLIEGTLPTRLETLPMNKFDWYRNVLVTNNLDIATISHLGKLYIPSDLHLLGSISSKLSYIIAYSSEGIDRIRKAWSDNGGPRVECLKWHEKISEYIKNDPDIESRTPELSFSKLLLMGTSTKGLREFINESLTDRTLEKWSNTVTSSLHQIKSISLYNVIPALERTLMLFEQLQSFAKSPEDFSEIPIDYVHLENIIKVTSDLIYRLWNLVQLIADEIVKFLEFMKFMKYQMNKHSYYNQEEAEEVLSMPKPCFDISSVIRYLESGFINVQIDKYLITKNKKTTNTVEDEIEDLSLEFAIENAEQRLKDIKKFNKNSDSLDVSSKKNKRVSGNAIPMRKNIDSNDINKECDKYIENDEDDLCMTMNAISESIEKIIRSAIANSESRMDFKGREVFEFEGDEISVIKDKIVNIDGKPYQYIAFAEHLKDIQKDSSIHIYRAPMNTDNKSWELQRLHLPTTRIVDFDFFDDDVMVVLTHDKDNGEFIIATVFYNSLEFDGSLIQAPLDRQRTLEKSLANPISISVNGLPGRRIAVILTNDGSSCQVFDIDTDEVDSDENIEMDEE